MTPTPADLAAAEALWSAEARRARCLAAGVNLIHARDFTPDADDVAALLAAARAEERARIARWLVRESVPGRRDWRHDLADAIEHNEHAAERGEEE